MPKILSFVMIAVLTLAILSPIYPFVLLIFSHSFPFAIAFSITFSLIAAEKIYAMIFRMREKNLMKANGDWTAAAVGLSYTLVMYLALLELHWRVGTDINLKLSAAGVVFYALAVSWRYWAFHHLGRQWAVHLDRGIDGGRNLIQEGPYAIIRHPLYAGACVEALAVPLIFNGLGAVALACLTFIPLELGRAKYEERFLRETFGLEYEKYAARIGGFLPRPRICTTAEFSRIQASHKKLNRQK